MFSLLKRTILLIIGFLLIAVVIWFAGPYVGLGVYHPLGSVTARLIAIGLVVGGWLLWRLVKRLRAYAASDRLLAAVIAPRAEAAAPSPEAAKLRERFETAVAALKQQRRSGHSLYDLPWYVIIGAPGSGKTTALLNSGLTFPLEQRVGKGALRGVGGTRNCDWWFTDEAIFLDTAGRYTTQDSDASSDSAGWSEFLALLRQYRARRPVNGVILTINAQDLIAHGDQAREAHVDAARRRLIELNRELRIQLPVYLMVTKCDLVAGFTEYFDDLTLDGRRQVWGVTFPYERTNATAAAESFPAEFDDLMERLNGRVFARVEESREPRRRTRIFAFPQQMAALRDVLAQFVSEVFTGTQFDQQILLRGVYLTSGTQEGTPVDRLLAGIGRRFGVMPQALAPVLGPGKSYFVERLLREVMIGESGLAGVNRRLEARKAVAALALYAALALVAAAGVIALTVSYSRNRAYLEQAAADVAVVQRLPPVPASAPLESVVPRLEAIRAVVDSADRYRGESAWAMRWGLYQGGSIGDAARDAYLRELDGLLLPRVAERIKTRISEYGRDPERLVIYLKAYLMLGEPARLDKKHLQWLADLEWKERAGVSPTVGAALSKHFASLLESEARLRPLALDRTLIAQAQSSIRQVSLPRIFYSRIKRTYADDHTHDVQLAAVAGIGADQVFRRKSRVSLATPVPGFYSKARFQEIVGAGRAELVAELAADNWVWGEGNAPADPAAVALAVSNLYELDYIKAWEEVLDDLTFVAYPTVIQTSDALRIVAGPASPLRALLRVVVDNTALADPPKPAETPGLLSAAREKLTQRYEAMRKSLDGAAGPAVPAMVPGALIAGHFQPIQQLLTGDPGKAPIDAIISRIAEIQQQLATLGPDAAGVAPSRALASPALRGLLQSLEQQADGLPPWLRSLVLEIGGESRTVVLTDATKELALKYQQVVLPECRTLIEGRYPFRSDSTRVVTLAEFSRLFGYGGVFDKFFTENLAAQVNAAARPWTWLPGAPQPPGLLEQLESARRVRELFFPEGAATPSVPFQVTFTDLAAGDSRFVLQVDGQLREVKPKQAAERKAIEWPGQGGGEAIATFESRFLPKEVRRFNGPWAWFQMIDATAKGAPDAQQRVPLEISDQFHRVTVTVEPASARNPFAVRDWRQFRCS